MCLHYRPHRYLMSVCIRLQQPNTYLKCVWQYLQILCDNNFLLFSMLLPNRCYCLVPLPCCCCSSRCCCYYCYSFLLWSINVCMMHELSSCNSCMKNYLLQEKLLCNVIAGNVASALPACVLSVALSWKTLQM